MERTAREQLSSTPYKRGDERGVERSIVIENFSQTDIIQEKKIIKK